MNKQQINVMCRQKIEEILDQNFGILAQDESLDQLSVKYPKDLPERLISDFRNYLQSILDANPNNQTKIDELINAHTVTIASAQKYKDEYELYYGKALEVTLFEKLTNTNKNDVAKYKYALYKYTETILYSMKDDFIFDLK